MNLGAWACGVQKVGRFHPIPDLGVLHIFTWYFPWRFSMVCLDSSLDSRLNSSPRSSGDGQPQCAMGVLIGASARKSSHVEPRG